jgi:hypothetical protein
VRRKEYAAAASAYEAALALNPLYPDVWFSLGYCYLRLEQTHKALQVMHRHMPVTYIRLLTLCVILVVCAGTDAVFVGCVPVHVPQAYTPNCDAFHPAPPLHQECAHTYTS